MIVKLVTVPLGWLGRQRARAVAAILLVGILLPGIGQSLKHYVQAAVFLLLVTSLVFRWAGRENAFALGLVTSQRNLGLMLAATGGAAPPLVWLYIAVSQFPIYLTRPCC